jgi:hypothetical protein
MKRAQAPIELFGLDFGVREVELCTKCGERFISDETMEEVEEKAKELNLFGAERKVRVTKSGNSLVIRIPPDIAKLTGLEYKSLLSILPTGKGKIEIEVI